MAISGLPAVVNDFNIYNSGNKLVGTNGETAIPDLEPKTETVSGVLRIMEHVRCRLVNRYRTCVGSGVGLLLSYV